MSKREEAKLAKLIRKHAGKTPKPKEDKSPQYDDTLKARIDDDKTRRTFFNDMRRREF
jgi:hypothetical protein